MTRDGKTHIFKGKTCGEAMAKAKTKLGKNISVVKRRDVQESNLFSKLTQGKLGGNSLSVELEVIVTPPEDAEVAVKTPAKPAAPPHALRTYAKALEGVEKHSSAARERMAESAARFLSVGETATGIAGRLDDFQKTLEKTSLENASLRDELRMMLSLQARGGMPAVGPELLDGYRRLVENDVQEDLARSIAEEIQRDFPGGPGGPGSPGSVTGLIREALARRIPTAGPLLLRDGKPTVAALIGPSGVGKSTSVVKMAIHYSMQRRKSVSVINEDLQRPGADGQITNLGRLFGIPVITIQEPRELEGVVKSMSGRDLILIDTGGRSPRDERGIAQLGSILRAAGVDETHLLLSGVMSGKMMRETEKRYRPAGFDRVMLTKLDECLTHGELLNLAAGLACGLSYVTTGADYTSPLSAADSMALAELVLGEREVAAAAGAEAGASVGGHGGGVGGGTEGAPA